MRGNTGMKRDSCRRAETDALLYVSGELENAAEFEEHVKLCPMCAATIAEERELAAWMGALESVRLSDATRSAIAESAQTEDAGLPWLTAVREYIAGLWPRPALAAAWGITIILTLASGQLLDRATLGVATYGHGPDPGIRADAQSEGNLSSSSGALTLWDDDSDLWFDSDLTTLRNDIEALSSQLAQY